MYGLLAVSVTGQTKDTDGCLKTGCKLFDHRSIEKPANSAECENQPLKLLHHIQFNSVLLYWKDNIYQQ